MNLHFYKYQGCGNDFIILDNRSKEIKLSTQQINQLCNRHFGIGADGLMLLEPEQGYDFKMVYYNSDGNESSMCGNGGRCITAFAKQLGVIKESTRFMAIDGEHICELKNNEWTLKMQDVKSIQQIDKDTFFLNTGSPHIVKWVDDIDTYPVYKEGKKIRYDELFKSGNGTNVNFVQLKKDKLVVRTYERGVENETLACGTGVTAAALIEALVHHTSHTNFCDVITLGGSLTVTYQKHDDASFSDIWLKGPAEFIFEGDFALS